MCLPQAIFWYNRAQEHQNAPCVNLAVTRPLHTRNPVNDFATVYDEHVWQVYGFFAYRMRDRRDAEDLTQKTFERALKSWSRYDPQRAGVTTWLLAIARNLHIDHIRADRGARQEPLDELDAAHSALVGRADRPDIGLEPALEEALAHLGSRDLEIIALRFGGELTGPEIAEATGLSLANVQQILSRSLRRMRVAMERTEATAQAVVSNNR